MPAAHLFAVALCYWDLITRSWVDAEALFTSFSSAPAVGSDPNGTLSL